MKEYLHPSFRHSREGGDPDKTGKLNPDRYKDYTGKTHFKISEKMIFYFH